MKSFLFANVPLSVVHFMLFVIFGGFLGQPGALVANALGAADGGLLWWAIMVVNSLVWGTVLSLFVFPFIRKLMKWPSSLPDASSRWTQMSLATEIHA